MSPLDPLTCTLVEGFSLVAPLLWAQPRILLYRAVQRTTGLPVTRSAAHPCVTPQARSWPRCLWGWAWWWPPRPCSCCCPRSGTLRVSLAGGREGRDEEHEWGGKCAPGAGVRGSAAEGSLTTANQVGGGKGRKAVQQAAGPVSCLEPCWSAFSSTPRSGLGGRSGRGGCLLCCGPAGRLAASASASRREP
jgi:hypothetical protein